MTKPDPFADIRDKRLSEMSPEQQDRAHELWTRENLGWHQHQRSTLEAILRVIDRLRADYEPQTAREARALALRGEAWLKAHNRSMTAWTPGDSEDMVKALKADPELGPRMMRSAGIWDENNNLTKNFGGTGTPVHVLFETKDHDKPSTICDSNGEVVLGLCKRCGRAEIELEEPCVPRDVKGSAT